MTFTKSLCFVLVLAATSLTALADSNAVTIGCTIDCGPRIGERVAHASAAMGVPVQLVDLSSAPGPAAALSNVDAVISPGGDDIDVRFYLDAVSPDRTSHVVDLDSRLGQHSEESRLRDQHEYELRQAYFSGDRFREVAFIGICYGMQMLAVSQGLPLVIDLHEEYGIANRRNLFDDIHLAEGSLAASIFGTTELKALENHHQAVDVREYERIRPDSIRLTGFSNQQLVPEAIEFRSRPLALGVQFHPERSDMGLSDRIFGWVIARGAEHHRHSMTEAR